MRMVTMRKRTSDVAACVDVEWRPCCLKYFHTVRRCIQHLSCGSERREQAVVEHLPVIAAATPCESKLT
eukprot:9034529-Alexandrium_andersonii.AAC.1